VTPECRDRWRFTLLVAPLAMLGPFSLDTYLPSFPAMAEALAVGSASMQATFAVYLVAFAAATLIVGPWSDLVGRRPVVLFATLGFVLASLLLMFAMSFWQVLALRVAQGVTVAAGVVVGRAIVRDRFATDEARRVFALITMVFALGPAIAPMVGGLLQSMVGWRAVFGFLAVYGLAVGVALYVWLPETLPRSGRIAWQPLRILGQYPKALRNPDFFRPIAVLAVFFSILFIFVAGSPVIIYEHLAGGENDFWWLFGPLVIGLFTGGLVSGRLVSRLSPDNSVRLGLALSGLALVALGVTTLLFNGSPWMLMPLLGYSFALSLTMPALTVMALDCYPRARGMAAALQSFTQLTIGAIVVLFLVDWLVVDMLRIVVAALLLWLLSTLLWIWRVPRRSGTSPVQVTS
jgi:DHA1 family bicyclomycin/chloramphenicol resistance-like MFS transporter